MDIYCYFQIKPFIFPYNVDFDLILNIHIDFLW